MKSLRGLVALAPLLCALRAETLPPATVIDTYAAISSVQNERMRGASMQVDIEAALPKLKKQGRLHALRRISRLGRITYEVLHFEGDNTVKTNVIARYLTAEAESQAEGARIENRPAESAVAVISAAAFGYWARMDVRGTGRFNQSVTAPMIPPRLSPPNCR